MLFPSDSVVALYVDPRGVYPHLVEQWYDEQRDARTYEGSSPIVAHPPCGPWGQMRALCTRQPAWAGPHAVDVVRRCGGVLEHPAGSKLWDACHMPRPEQGEDAFHGRSYYVEQVHWGHACLKPTWLYVVGVDMDRVVAAILASRVPSEPTHVVTTGPRFDRRGLRVASGPVKRRTPERFARLLLELASIARRPWRCP